jgi:hypothetical protein
MSPTSGAQAGGTSVTITGDNFNQGAKVNFAGAPGVVQTVTKGSITATTPQHAVGLVDVEVINPDNRSSILRNGFTYA